MVLQVWATLRVGLWELDVLHPLPGRIRQNNRSSLVLKASVHDRTFLLTGDIDAATEIDLLRRSGDDLSSIDAIKLAHHGSKTSTAEQWLDHTRPGLALISCGLGNRYGHPAPAVIERLARRGIPTLRTDRSGAISLSIKASGQLQIETPGSPKG